MTELERIDTDKLKAEIKRQKEINKMLIAHEEDYIKTLHGLQVKIEALQDDNNNLYKTKMRFRRTAYTMWLGRIYWCR